MKIDSRIKKTNTIKITGQILLEFLQEKGYNIDRGNVTFRVPSGGGWSYTDIDVDEENPITVQWVEEYEE